MGYSNLTLQRLHQKLNEFELRQPYKIMASGGKKVVLHMVQHHVGDYYASGVTSKDYQTCEEQFKELMTQELIARKTDMTLMSKEAFTLSLMRDNVMRKSILTAVRESGMMHAYRWRMWYVLATHENGFKTDEALTSRRKGLFEKLNQKRDKEVEDMLGKDVMRTASSKELFKDDASLGHQLLHRVCKAVGKFFPRSGYIQGMNFVAAFALEVSGMEEFEAFNFIVSFWKKDKNLFYGMYEHGLPVLYFMKFAFERLLELVNPRLHAAIQRINLPAELWIFKWFLSFFTIALDREFVLRIFDYLLVNDVFGPVYVALAIADQLTDLFEGGDFISIGETINSSQKLSERICFSKFNQKLEQLDFDSKFKVEVLREYNKGLGVEEKSQFGRFYARFEKHFMKGQLRFYDDFGFDRNSEDYDKIGLNKLSAQVDVELRAEKAFILNKENTKKGSLKSTMILARFEAHADSKHHKTGEMCSVKELNISTVINMR